VAEAAAGGRPRTRAEPGTVGIVGAGQLARMLLEAASALGVDTVVMAEDRADAAARVGSRVLLGSPLIEHDLRELAAAVDVVTFDHELVDLELLGELEAEGAVVRPSAAALEMAADKATMRVRLSEAGIAVPAFAVVGDARTPDPLDAVAAFAHRHGWPVVLKAVRGGYDGRGVWPVPDLAAAAEVCAAAASRGLHLLVEELVPIELELAVLVARRPGGQSVVWPTVETTQVDGVCREVAVPGRLPPAVGAEAGRVAGRVAEVVGSVGVLAVELFFTGTDLVVNEVATRPHNTGHWTIEGAVTSQFENHLRAVLDLPLGDPSPSAPHVASVNVFGGASGQDPAGALAGALSVPGAHVHLYGKAPRPGRKLGHVTVRGDDPADVRRRAWAAALALGTPVPGGVELPPGLAAPVVGAPRRWP